MVSSTAVLIGTSGCGKSCLCIRLIADRFVSDYEPTLEDLYRKQLDVDGKAEIMDIFDTAGLDGFQLVRDSYIRNGKGFLFVYSINNKPSFNEIQLLFDHVMRIKDTEDAVPCVLVGTKCDLVSDREVSAQEGQQMAKTIGASFIEASSLTGENVTEVFHQLLREIRKLERSETDTPKEKPKRDSNTRSPRCLML